MKPRVLTAVVAALAVTLVGCSGKATEGKAGEEGKGGIKTGPGVSSSTISLGVLTDMTGVYASLGKSVTQAQQLWVKQTNEAGGICDRKIELTVRDHGYDPQKAIAAYTELVPDVAGFAQFIGSPFVAAVEQRV
ncbi:ABC transporter substrate-binding protein, partial [Streptomyces globisporus]